MWSDSSCNSNMILKSLVNIAYPWKMSGFCNQFALGLMKHLKNTNEVNTLKIGQELRQLHQFALFCAQREVVSCQLIFT